VSATASGSTDRNAIAMPPFALSPAHRGFAELIADPLAAALVPLFAAVGGQDTSSAHVCPEGSGGYGCEVSGKGAPALSSGWREAFSAMPAPWGDGDPPSKDGD